MNKLDRVRARDRGPIQRHISFPWLLSLLALVACSAPLSAENAPSSEPVQPRPARTAAIETRLPQKPPDDCPVTRPPASSFVPPDPQLQDPNPGYFWYGTYALWTELPEDGRWHALPYDQSSGYSQKVFFFREAYDGQTEPQPALVLEGRRLDAEAPSLKTTPATNGYHHDLGSFMLVGVGIPTAGCWAFTGRYGQDALTFVVWVAP